MMKQQKGFTLAETLITLTILGVVAAITVPMLINKQMEAANRTKVKKSMAAYEKALNQMIIENDLKDGAAISAFNGAINNGVNALDCVNTRPYFKAIENGNTNCRFKTADRVWWDITDIQHPIIALNDDYKNATLLGNGADTLESLAKSSDNKEVFGMVGTIEDGVVRINDKGGVAPADEDYVDKLYTFISNGNESASSGVEKMTYAFGSCEIDKEDSNKCTKGVNTYKKITVTNDTCATGWAPSNSNNCVSKGESFWIMESYVDTNTYVSGISSCDDIVEFVPSCTELNGPDNWAAATYYCMKQGGTLATIGQLNIAGYTNDVYWANGTTQSGDGLVFGYGNSAYDARNLGYKAVCVGTD